jgi:hypothetical protein
MESSGKLNCCVTLEAICPFLFKISIEALVIEE